MKTAYVLFIGLCKHYFRICEICFHMISLTTSPRRHQRCCKFCFAKSWKSGQSLPHVHVVGNHLVSWRNCQPLFTMKSLNLQKNGRKKLPPMRIRWKSLLPCGSISRYCPVISLFSFSNRCDERLQEWFMKTNQTISVIGHTHCHLYASATVLLLY